MGEGAPQGVPTMQTSTFDALDGGMTRTTMAVGLPDPQGLDEFVRQSAASLKDSFDAMDRLIAG